MKMILARRANPMPIKIKPKRRDLLPLFGGVNRTGFIPRLIISMRSVWRREAMKMTIAVIELNAIKGTRTPFDLTFPELYSFGRTVVP